MKRTMTCIGSVVLSVLIAIEGVSANQVKHTGSNHDQERSICRPFIL